MKKYPKWVVVALLFLTILLGIFVALLFRWREDFFRKNESDALLLMQQSIEHAKQNDGIFIAPDSFFLLVPHEFYTHEMLKMLEGQAGIRHVDFDGRSVMVMDEQVAGYFASMPDMESLNIEAVPLRGNVFSILNTQEKLEKLWLMRCLFDTSTCDDLGNMIHLKKLDIHIPRTISSSPDGSESIRETDEQIRLKMVNSICKLKQLESLAIDASFKTWSEQLSQALPDTEIVFRSWE